MPHRRKYSGRANGKAPPEFMARQVYGNLGRGRSEIIVGPGTGLDNAVLALPAGGVLVVTTDPISMIPSAGAERSAWLSVHLVASDLTASGVDPEFATFSYNFPPEMDEVERGDYLRAVGEECSRLGVSIVGGNTGSYPGGGYTVIGAGTMFGRSRPGEYVTPAMAMVGDSLLMTKHAAIEAALTLAASFPVFVRGKVGERRAKRAAAMAGLCTTVEDARSARRVGLGKGGVTSMHDATEGGVLGAIEEMAEASGKAFVVDPEKIPVMDDAESVCSAFGIDPLRTMGEGALLITCAPARVDALRKILSAAGISSAEIGKVERGVGLWLLEAGRKSRSAPGSRDPFWRAYEQALARGLK